MTVTGEQLEQMINKALKKINGDRENDICKFLPFNGGYMHHFTLRKMKSESPEELSKMLNDYIMNVANPKRVGHKPRKPRGSRRRPDLINLTREELDRLLAHIRGAGDHEIAAKFSRKKSLASIKKALIATIRQNSVDHELWNAYLEAVTETIDPSSPDARPRPVASAMVQLLNS